MVDSFTYADEYPITQSRVIHIEDPPFFDRLWNLFGKRKFSREVKKNRSRHLRDKRIEQIAVFDDFDLREMKKEYGGDKSPLNCYLLTSHDIQTGKIRILSCFGKYPRKHTIGEHPDHLPSDLKGIIKYPHTGPIYTIADFQLYDKKILNLFTRDNAEQIASNEYLEIIEDMGIELHFGDMVHIPLYDSIVDDMTNRVRRFILIMGYEDLLRPENDDTMGDYVPSIFSFPNFDIEHFSPLGENGTLPGLFIHGTKKVIEAYISTPVTCCMDEFQLKKVKINNEYYYMTNDISLYPNIEAEWGAILRVERLFEYFGQEELPIDENNLNALVLIIHGDEIM